MILLQYVLEAYSVNYGNDFPLLAISESNIRENLTKILRRYILRNKVWKFSNGDHPCLSCHFTHKIHELDLKLMANKKELFRLSEEQIQFHDSIINRITTELMAYERQEYEYREIEI